MRVFATTRVVVASGFAPYAVSVLLFRRAEVAAVAGGSCRQGAGRDRLRRASGWPGWATVSSCFVPGRSGGVARGLWSCAGLALAVSVRQRRQGGYRARRIGCPAMGAEAEMLPWQRDAGRRCVCRYIQRIVAPRGFITHGALPTAYNPRVATQSWSAPMQVLWSHPTHSGYACFSGWPSTRHR